MQNKKKGIRLACLATAFLLIASVGGADTVIAGNVVPDLEISEPSEGKGKNEAFLPWEDCYLSFLYALDRGSVKIHIQYNDSFAEVSKGPDANLFSLYDIDKDGIPELIWDQVDNTDTIHLLSFSGNRINEFDCVGRRALGWEPAYAVGDTPYYITLHDTGEHFDWSLKTLVNGYSLKLLSVFAGPEEDSYYRRPFTCYDDEGKTISEEEFQKKYKEITGYEIGKIASDSEDYNIGGPSLEHIWDINGYLSLKKMCNLIKKGRTHYSFDGSIIYKNGKKQGYLTKDKSYHIAALVGSDLYYIVQKEKKIRLEKQNLKTKKKTRLLKLPYDRDWVYYEIDWVNQDAVYIKKNIAEIYYESGIRFDLKTKKAIEFNPGAVIAQSGDYLVLSPVGDGGQFKFYICNATTCERIATLTEGSITGVDVHEDCIYYTEPIDPASSYYETHYKVNLMRYNFIDGSRETILSSIDMGELGAVTNDYVYYAYEDIHGFEEPEFYRYSFKSKKSYQITKGEYIPGRNVS